MPQTRKQYNYHKLFRQTGGFVKRPSARYKRKQNKKLAESIRNEIADYDDHITIIESDGTVHNLVDKAANKKFGIFHIKGYRAIKLFVNKEDAEKELATWRNPALYQVREITWYEEDFKK